MATHVYANGNEIASKSADGSSKHAFPDICHTPPATASPTPIKPFPPGVPIPYPNSCHASDITNGSRTVFILGKEIALENHSYFSVSEGDQEATKFLARGLISAEVTGRCFFQTWSPNVKVEGRAVTRHLDLVSHNHKNPSNTALFPYLSNAETAAACKDEETRIKRACDEDNGEERDKPSVARPKRGRPGASTTRNSRGTESATQTWIQNHCNGLLSVKAPDGNSADPDFYMDQLKQFQDEVADLQQYLTDMNAAKALLEQKVTEWAIEKGAKIAAKAAAKQAVGTFIPGVGNVIMGAWSAAEAIQFTSQLAELKDEVTALLDDIDSIQETLRKSTRMADRIKALEEGSPLSINGEPDSPSRVFADLQDTLANTNACLRARRCSLVPFGNRSGVDASKRSETQTSKNNGCCPGQTGHHLIPRSAIEKKADGLGCEHYKDTGRGASNMHSAAPTVCVEGTNQSAGSHGRIHRNLGRSMRATKDQNSMKGRLWNRRPIVGPDNAIEMEDLIDFGTKSLVDTFPLSRCSPECIKAQLEAFYETGKCKDSTGRMIGNSAHPVRPSPSNNE